MQALDMHEEASLKPQGVQKYFNQGEETQLPCNLYLEEKDIEGWSG